MSDPTQTSDEAFLKLCEALGIQATAMAYLEVPAILMRAERRGAERAMKDALP